MKVSVSFDMPRRMAFEFKDKSMRNAAGRKIATGVKRSIRRGVTPSGRQLPRGRDGGRAWRDTGELLRSIKYKKTIVGPWGPHSSGLNAAGLAGVLVFGHRRSVRRERLGNISPFEADAPAVKRWAEEGAQADLNRQVRRKQARIEGRGGRKVIR